VKKIGV
jgi:hypothetical protein